MFLVISLFGDEPFLCEEEVANEFIGADDYYVVNLATKALLDGDGREVPLCQYAASEVR